MKKLFCILVLLVSSNVNADECFNASEISRNAAYVAAPDIEAAIVASASDFGWSVDKQAAQIASYRIVGHLGAVRSDDLMVCITLNSDGNLALQSYPVKMGKEAAPYTPLNGKKK